MKMRCTKNGIDLNIWNKKFKNAAGNESMTQQRTMVGFAIRKDMSE